MSNEIYRQINQISMELRLPAFRNDLDALVAKATKTNAPYEQLILELLQTELETRLINRKKAQLRIAGFPQLSNRPTNPVLLKPTHSLNFASKFNLCRSGFVSGKRCSITFVAGRTAV